MTGEIRITVVGNLTDDPELKFTQSGSAVANFNVASTPRVYDKQTEAWGDGETIFLRVSAWRHLGQNCAESLRKGSRVVVTGVLRIRDFERTDGSKGKSVELNADEVAASLQYATAALTKAARTGLHAVEESA